MERSKIIAGILAVFLSGIVIGAAISAFYMKSRMFEMLDNPPKPPEEFIVQKLSEDLGLSAKQRQAVQEIVSTYSARMHKEISSFKPRLDAILDEMTAQLKMHLEPAQQKKLDEIVAGIKSHKGPPGGPFGPPPGEGPGGPDGPHPGGPPPGGPGGPPPGPPGGQPGMGPGGPAAP